MTILLLDGHNLLMRAFSTLPRTITDRNGQPINAVYGFLNVMLRLARQEEETRIAVAFDVPEVPTFRSALFPAYQGQRGPLGGEHADELAAQTAMVQQVLDHVGIPALAEPGYEADDVMGTLAVQQEGEPDVRVISTDKDLLQLVRPGVGWQTPQNPPLVATAAEDVVRILGVGPEQVTTYKALAGDSSDNYPGVRGIGGKTAISLVREHGTLEDIYAALPQLSPSVARKLEEGREAAFLFRDIATVRTGLNLPLSLAQVPPLPLASDARARQILRDAGIE